MSGVEMLFDLKIGANIPGTVDGNTVVPFPSKREGNLSGVIVPGGPTFVAICDLPDREPDFLIDGLIETDCLASVFGDPGHGKSFFAIDLALCVATGNTFHGRDVQAGSVFYIAGEGHNGLGRRTKAWAKHQGKTLDRVPLFASTKAANFLNADHAEFVARQIDSLAAMHGEPRLIVIDTLARNFGDGDENNTADMNLFVAAMDDLRTRYTSSTVLVVHHTGHGDKSRARGAMAFKGALDAEFQVSKSDSVVTVTCKKMKEGEEPAPIAFTLEAVALGMDRKGNEYGSAILLPCDAPAAKAAKLSAGKRLALDAFRLAARDTGTKRDNGFRGVHLEDWRAAYYQKSTAENEETKRRSFNRVRQDLVSGDILIVNNDLYQIGRLYPYDAQELI